MLHCTIALDIPQPQGQLSDCAAHNSRLTQKAKEIMAKTETSKNGFFDVAKAFGNFRLPGLDVEAVVATQRKNLEALTQASQLAVEGVQAMARRQTEIARQAVQDATEVVRDWTQPGALDERLVKNVETAKQAFEKGLASVREFNELTTKASTDVFGVIAKRVSESFDEVRHYAKKSASA
jgi:phasin family protein